MRSYRSTEVYRHRTTSSVDIHHVHWQGEDTNNLLYKRTALNIKRKTTRTNKLFLSFLASDHVVFRFRFNTVFYSYY